MENDVLDSLEDLGYSGPLLDGGALSEALEAGSKSVAYTELVEWLVSQLSSFCGIDEKVHAIQGPGDAEGFLLELSGFLREFSCPYDNLAQGPIEGRLASKQSCVQLLDYLLTELASVKMVASKRPGVLASMSKTQSVEPMAEPSESDTAKHLREMLMTLKFSKPPPNITGFQLFSKIESKTKELMSKHPNQIGKPLLKTRLSEKQWAHILDINDVLNEEYKVRREMLLKRLDVTIQSFKWSDKAKSNDNQIAAVYQPIRRLLNSKTNVGVPEILSARDDLTRLQKVTSGEARERSKCAINKVLIGKVPDRGGRAWELEPPPPEMPSFMKRDAGGGRGGGFGGGGGRGGGGGFQSNGHQGGGGGYQGGARGGSYQGGGGGGNQGGGGGGGYQGGGGGGYQGGGGGGYQGGGGGGRGGRGGGGGRVQGGWGDSQQQTQNYGGNWNQGGGGYGGGRGGGGGNQGGGNDYQQGGGGGYQGGGNRGGGNDYQQGGGGGRGRGRGRGGKY